MGGRKGRCRSQTARCRRGAAALVVFTACCYGVWSSKAAEAPSGSRTSREPAATISPLYHAAPLKEWLRIVGSSGEEGTTRLPGGLESLLMTMRSRDATENIQDLSIVLTESDAVVGSCSGYLNTASNSATFNAFVLDPEVLDARAASRTLMQEVLQSASRSGATHLNVVTDPEDIILTETMASLGFFLTKHEPQKDKPKGFYRWKTHLPYAGSFDAHRSAFNEAAATDAHVKSHKVAHPLDAPKQMTPAEREMTSESFIMDYRAAEPVEQARAALFVRERVLEGATALEKSPVDITSPDVVSYILATEDFTVLGVLAGRLSKDKSVFSVDFLGVSDEVDHYAKAALLAEALRGARAKGAERMVLRAVSVQDIAAVSAAAELQFKIKAKSEDTFLMVMDYTTPYGNLDAIVLPRKLDCQARGWRRFEARMRSVIGAVPGHFEILEALKDGARGHIAKQTLALFLYVGAIMAAVLIGLMLRERSKAKRRSALIKRVRGMTLVDDGEARTAEQPVLVPAEASAHTRAPGTPGGY